MARYTTAHAAVVKRVFLNGEDVTNRCTMADTDKGYVKLLRAEPNKLAYEEFQQGPLIVYGDVEVELHEWAKPKRLESIEVETWEGDRIVLTKEGQVRGAPATCATFECESFPYDVYFWQTGPDEVDYAYVFYEDDKRLKPGEIWERLRVLDEHKKHAEADEV